MFPIQPISRALAFWAVLMLAFVPSHSFRAQETAPQSEPNPPADAGMQEMIDVPPEDTQSPDPAEDSRPRRFRHAIDARRAYRMVSTNTQTIFLNGFAVRDAEIVTRVQIEPQGVEDGRGLFRATFQLTERSRLQGQPVGLESEYESVYTRTPLGDMQIDPEYIMPVARNFPVFPERAVEPGDTWSAEAREVHDLYEGYNLEEPLRFSFPVSYEYVGPVTLGDRLLHRIDAGYNISHRENRDAALYPQTITGQSEQTLYWDARRGRPAASEEEYWIEFRLSDGRTITYQGRAETEVVESQPLDRGPVIDAIQRRLAEEGIENTRVTGAESGVALVLEQIGFPPDSARILPEERERLERIADILAEYPENDLEIRGHTALAGTEQGREQLSVARARAVGEFLLDMGIRDPERILFRGFGATRPIADNDTPEGRARNRRVEILVLDN